MQEAKDQSESHFIPCLELPVYLPCPFPPEWPILLSSRGLQPSSPFISLAFSGFYTTNTMLLFLWQVRLNLLHYNAPSSFHVIVVMPPKTPKKDVESLEHLQYPSLKMVWQLLFVLLVVAYSASLCSRKKTTKPEEPDVVIALVIPEREDIQARYSGRGKKSDAKSDLKSDKMDVEPASESKAPRAPVPPPDTSAQASSNDPEYLTMAAVPGGTTIFGEDKDSGCQTALKGSVAKSNNKKDVFRRNSEGEVDEDDPEYKTMQKGDESAIFGRDKKNPMAGLPREYVTIAAYEQNGGDSLISGATGREVKSSSKGGKEKRKGRSAAVQKVTL